jgi:hypothetical protein
MIKFSLKHAVAVAAMAGVSAGASAEDFDLGTITAGAEPTVFSNVVSGTSWSDTFEFSVSEPNIGAAATVVDIPLSHSGFTFDTGLSTLTLMSAGEDQILGNVDDTQLQSVVFDPSNPGPNGDNLLSVSYEGTLSGLHYLNVTGVTTGEQGGVYSGAIAAAVPEPETYAMLLAGLGLMAGVVRRRSMRKGS